MSRQAFGILPKVREVDEILSSDKRLARRVIEVHPEVCELEADPERVVRMISRRLQRNN